MNSDIQERAKKIKAVALDADGVIFTGHVFMNADGTQSFKKRSNIDAQGISLLRSAGIHVAVVSGGPASFASTLVEYWNGLPSAKSKEWPPMKAFTGVEMEGEGKVKAVGGWLDTLGISWEECAVMGDDIADFELLKKAALAAAPAQAEAEVKEIAHYISPRRGGDGAVRDLANLILSAQGKDITTLSLR